MAKKNCSGPAGFLARMTRKGKFSNHQSKRQLLNKGVVGWCASQICRHKNGPVVRLRKD
ncbi:hypothetical protein [Desulfotruncus arcticus]|uniref:hypothetical protein n=1 Tax=Desulfotruncus arcticus TaxID=341036 RepID=UPI0013F4D41C|nr:hypothetical protein [Desulfotruncus arcticus]